MSYEIDLNDTTKGADFNLSFGSDYSKTVTLYGLNAKTGVSTVIFVGSEGAHCESIHSTGSLECFEDLDEMALSYFMDYEQSTIMLGVAICHFTKIIFYPRLSVNEINERVTAVFNELVERKVLVPVDGSSIFYRRMK